MKIKVARYIAEFLVEHGIIDCFMVTILMMLWDTRRDCGASLIIMSRHVPLRRKDIHA